MEAILLECDRCLETLGPVIDNESWTHIGCKCGNEVPRPSPEKREEWRQQKAVADVWRATHPEKWAAMVESWI